MKLNKLTSLLIFAGFTGMYNLAGAAVHDFGNLSTASAQIGSMTATKYGTSGISAQDISEENSSRQYAKSDASFNNFDFLNARQVDSAPESSSRNVRHENKFDVNSIKRKVSDGKIYKSEHHDESPNTDSKKHDEKDGYLVKQDISNLSDDEHRFTPIASPVPEPETYAMILAGLGLIALTLRRRNDTR